MEKKRDFLEANLNTLRRLNSPIVPWLARHKATARDFQSCLVTNRRGMLDWQLASGRSLFDAISPEVAYRDWIPKNRPATSATVIVGCNLGYGLNTVLGGTPDTHKVLVLEPRADMVTACLSQTDYRPFMEKEKLLFVPPDRALLPLLAWELGLQFVYGNIFLRSDMPSRQLGPEYAAWSELWYEALEDMASLMTTLRSNQDVMVRHELENFARSVSDGNVLSVKGQGRGVTAVVLGAGPSLSRFAPLLAANRAGAVYVSSLQTLPALRAHGLKPDFCMAVDFTPTLEGVYKRVDKQWLQDIPLIYSRAISPAVLAAYPGPTLPVWTLGGLGTNLPRSREFVLDAGGNVGVALARFLVWCEVDRIVLVGQDFAWSGERMHASGHVSDEARFRFDPTRHVCLRDKDGRTIYSVPAYLIPLRTLEREIEQWRIPVFNLYGGGAVIKGTTMLRWEDILKKGILSSEPGRRAHFLHALSQARGSRHWPVFEARGTEWRRSIQAVKKRLIRVFDKSDRSQTHIHALLSQILVFVRQDPLYQPYLFKEILALAGLAHATDHYGRGELEACQEILDKVADKVEEVDRALVYDRIRAAA
ncbi:MAG: motility associated factor glycosyltransferase family protein [Deltaproteobacteria bacterium]|nr:motility associated factor glycosyltransferase family protein [Deltaproteobacteria bacterium]